MANSKLIIVEGAQGAGKTTVTDYLRYSLKYTNLYRLSGTSDSTIEGKKKSYEMYLGLLDYMKSLENKSINLLFDRTFFTEENYCRLGKKDYSFTDYYFEILDKFSKLDFDIYYITLYLENEDEFYKRLDRKDKAVPEYAKFNSENSVAQQREYLNMANEIRDKYPSIHVINLKNDRDFEFVKKELNEIFDINK